ncbi:MAG: hypothetical protein OXQ89_06390 [Rhodospirillaceae bacterium]|nr:hypothetical protein [Rhodospirillaceae bacterium]
MEVIVAAIDRGHFSVRRAVIQVRLQIKNLQELFTVHGVEFSTGL